jgi:hypothetical protein
MQLNIEFATPADDAAIRALCRREVMPGKISVTFEREPSFSLGCSVTGENVHIVVARNSDDGQIVGVACRSVRAMFVNGREQQLGYLSQLRIDRRFRGRWLLSRGFSFLKDLHDRDPVSSYLVSIVNGNREATGVLVENRRKVFPCFHPAAEYCTLAISVRRAKPSIQGSLEIRAGSSPEFAEIAMFLRAHGSRRQFFPACTEQSLKKLESSGLRSEDLLVARRNGQIVGVVGLWDQRAYKQTVVQAYRGWMKAAAPLSHFGKFLLGKPILPRPGLQLRSAYAALVCIANDDLDVFAGLLRELYNLAYVRGYEFVLLGLDSRDPFLRVAGEYAHVSYPSRFYLAEWSDGGHLHEHLDQRLAYLDIATL